MLFELVQWLKMDFSCLHLLSSLTFRAFMASMTAWSFCFFLGPFVIHKLHTLKVQQVIRTNGPFAHLVKAGVPTMGGILVLFAILFSTLLWADLRNSFIWILLFVMMGFGAIGWVDDYRKVVCKNSLGMRSKEKFLWQSLVGLITALCLPFAIEYASVFDVWKVFLGWSSGTGAIHFSNKIHLVLPFSKLGSYPLGFLGFILLSYFVIVGTSNAVNLTDGLDGLIAIPVALVGGALGIFSYVVGNFVYADNFLFPHIIGAGELLIFSSAMSGACLAFLWYNTYPAQVFMGDVGALSLGGALGTVAIIARQEIMLFVMGGVFVAETFSVILQVLFFQGTKRYYGQGRRLFKMAPLHHHFELSGWKEPQVVVRFWIVTMLLVSLGLSTLKLREFWWKI